MTREEIIDSLQFIVNMCEFDLFEGNKKPRELMSKETLTTINACEGAIAALKAQSCEDAVSRGEVLEKINNIGVKGFVDYNSYSEMFDFVDTLPPVTPKQRIGKWIETFAEDACGELYSYWACSECGRSVGYNLANIEDVLEEYPYCHCGARMKKKE